MSGPHPSVALTRLAVRTALQRTFPSDAAGERRVVAGVSGGADSLALAAALAFEAPKQSVAVDVVIVDHGLQAGSADVAERARRACVDQLGFADDDVRTVAVIVDAAASSPSGASSSAVRRRGRSGRGARGARAHGRRPGRAGAARPHAR